MDPIQEQKRNAEEYDRLMGLAAALNGPEEYDEWRRKK